MTENTTTPMPGVLHVYSAQHRLTAFESGCTSGSNAIVYIGGLGEGLASTEYLPLLTVALERLDSTSSDGAHEKGSSTSGWSLIQALTRSSYSGWGLGSIDRDAEDLLSLEAYLRRVKGTKGKLVLLGHSTGCQDIVRFWQLHHTTSTYSASILQAPVSDREYAEAPNTYADRDLLVRTIAACEAQIAAGDGAFFPPPATIREMYGGTPVSVSAERWVSMVARGGKEDFFSSDLTEEEMARAFCGMKAAAERQDRAKAKSLILVGGSDECVPDRIDKEKLVQRMARHAGPGAEGRVLEGANHNIEDVEAQRTFVDMVIDLIKGL